MPFPLLDHGAGAADVLVSFFLHGVFSRPFSGRSVVRGPVMDVLLGDGAIQGVIWIRIAEQTADGQENLRNGQSWGPIVGA